MYSYTFCSFFVGHSKATVFKADTFVGVGKQQIKRRIASPASVEDFLFAAPAPTQPLPSLSKLPSIYASLAKSRLTSESPAVCLFVSHITQLISHTVCTASVSYIVALVVLTGVGGYAMAPGVFDINTLLLLSAGTALQSAAANATNQIIEVKYDTQMYRTRNRVLVRGLIR